MNPVLAEVIRNEFVESCHRGSAIVVNAKGETLFALGDTDRYIYPRSSLKMFQAIPLLESGAADKYKMTEREIALSCASHNAEAIHTDAVNNWLDRLGLSPADLECGSEYPALDQDKHQLIENHQLPTAAHHNCSGKHSGMLTLTRHLDAAIKGYSEHQHPSQRAWMKSLSELVNIDISALKWERDGCGLPAICMPMERLAFACALFADPGNLPSKRAGAMTRIIKAIQKFPEMIAGTNRCCSAVISESNGSVIVKVGAEAVYVGIVPNLGLGFALKIDDGALRGSEVALGGLLKSLNAIGAPVQERLKNYFHPIIRNSQKKITGSIQPGSVWSSITI